MTPLLPDKKIYEIASLIVNKINIKDWQNYGAQAGLNENIIDLEGNPVRKWFIIVKAAMNGEKLPNLLDAVLKDFTDKRLTEILAEMRSGYLHRLERLVKSIKYNQCILFLGPGALTIYGNKDEKPFNELLAEHFAGLLDEKTKYYNETQKDNVSYMVQRYKRTVYDNLAVIGDIAIKQYKVYEAANRISMNVFEQLAKIPWKLVINTNPDGNLAKIMNKNKPDSCITRRYNLVNNYIEPNNHDMPANDQCLFYNLFGTFNEPASILFTDGDFLRFNTKVTQGTPPLNNFVTGMFDEDKDYLFLGFDFDQWYFKILFNKILNLTNKEERALSLHTGSKNFNESNIDFFEEVYKFYFVNDHLTTFLNNLISAYERPE